MDENARWFIEQIQNAKSMERLRYLGEAIKHDGNEDEPAEYTQDAEAMKQIRQAWGKRAKEIGS